MMMQYIFFEIFRELFENLLQDYQNTTDWL